MTYDLSRRHFLGAGILAGAAWSSRAALCSEIQSAAAKPLPIQLGLAGYTFRGFSRTQMIGYMKQLNLSALNAKDVKDHLPIDSALEAQAVADYTSASVGIHAAGAIYFAKDEDDDIRRKFEYCKRAGVPVIVAGDPAIETLSRIEKFVKEYDIRFAIHNHGPEDKLWKSPLDVLKAVHSMDAKMGCCIDVGHTARAGADVVEAIHRAGARLFNVHMKDLTDFTSKDSQVAVGDGRIPVRQIFEALIAIQYSGFVDLEYEVHESDPLPGVTASFAYMRGVLDGMGYTNHA